MAQEQQGAKHSATGYPRVHGCITGELAINHDSHLALCEEVRKPLVQGFFDAVLFERSILDPEHIFVAVRRITRTTFAKQKISQLKTN